MAPKRKRLERKRADVEGKAGGTGEKNKRTDKESYFVVAIQEERVELWGQWGECPVHLVQLDIKYEGIPGPQLKVKQVEHGKEQGITAEESAAGRYS